MKILFIGKYNETEILSGPEKVAKRLYYEVSKINSDTKLFTYFFKEIKRRKIKKILFGVETISSIPDIRRLGVIRLIMELVKEKPDLIHIVTMERFEIIILLLKSILRFKLVYTVHGIYRYERKILYKTPSLFSEFKDLLIEKLIFKYSDSLIFLSPQLIKLAENYYKINKYKVSIIPNGVSLPKFSVKKSFNFSNSIEIVFYNGLGSLRKRGLEDLITLLSKEKMGTFHLFILGSYIDTNYNQINFINPLPENLLFKFLNDKNIFIDNLSYIPFSIMALEAMSLGLIVIVSNQSGISSYINNGENGFIFDSNKPSEISEILKDILSNKFNLELLSTSAIATAKELSWDKIATQYLMIYRELLM